MDHVCHDTCECKVRLDVAMDVLALSSARLKSVIFSDSNEAIESAYSDLRIARMRFLAARAIYRESNLVSC